MGPRNLEIKESAVKEKRIWVRLTRRCNNGCLFCLDSDSHDGSAIPVEAIEAQIRRGREEGGQRLILSGGEPTIHPHFVDFVRLGRDLGYSWIQTVTNGRMFAYRKFATAAILAGLNEATFSMHGHTPELHDRLVGVQGAFNQSILGMRNLLGRVVVNVDVVLSALNIPHLREMLEFWISLGITEFDLLHIIPFGRAWNENRELLFYDPKKMMPHFDRAFALRKRQGIILWTNRLPAPFLEGNEDLIQDPHKLHDEVRGRLEMFREWEIAGKEPICKDDRCGHCPMDRFCAALGERLAAGTPASSVPSHVRLESIESATVESVRGALATVGEGGALYLPAELGVADLLAGLTEEERRGVRLYLLRHDYLSEAAARDLTVRELAQVRRTYGVSVEGIPACLGGAESDARDAEMPPLVDGDGRLDFVAFTDWFIRNRYFVKSLRCAGCVHDAVCRGLHINTARNWGLGVLRPVAEPAGARGRKES